MTGQGRREWLRKKGWRKNGREEERLDRNQKVSLEYSIKFQKRKKGRKEGTEKSRIEN